MAAPFTKVGPQCVPVGQIVFVGNIAMQGFAPPRLIPASR